MSKKGSALMQVLVIGLIIATFAILILRYAVTRSANISRTARVLEADIVADSCLEQYMSFLAAADLSGMPPTGMDMNCRFYTNPGVDDSIGNIAMTSTSGTDIDESHMLVTSFSIDTSNPGL
ncbi:MAG: hypothetical protein J5594_01945 [Elusimicrobiaceae bacterium]|nr:hypothetical protein [Elusimicrobiaceae bacterium]